MSALYRQARPSTFEEMVGQEHVKEVLLSALRADRLAQAYLFSGPRGVGKTSSARLIAQAVSCEQTPRPCGRCEGCRMVREGRHPDVLEIDAASNNSVEDVRDLQERILLTPILGRRKVVILDEAHMMSKSAFNALLKTLEEPPSHVIFIFATTEPERMPPTILSRTQHFRFRRLSEVEIAAKLERILAGLGREAESEALRLVARLADGALRDAESLLDRLLTLEGPLTLRKAEEALGLPPQAALFTLAEALDKGQLRSALETIERLYAQGFAARTLANGLLEALRAGLYARLGLAQGPQLQAPEERLVAAMTALDEAMEGLLKRSDALSLELALLRAHQALHPAPEPSQAEPVPKAPHAGETPPGLHPPRPEAGEEQDAGRTRASPHPKTSPTREDWSARWRQVLMALKPTVRAFVREAEPRLEEDRLVLQFPEWASFHFQNTQKHLEQLQGVVQEVLGNYRVELVHKKKPAEPGEPLAQLEPEAKAPEQVAPNWEEERIYGEVEAPPQAPLLEDPRFKRLVELFGGRLRRFHPEASPGELGVPLGEREEEFD
ncbi:DNA polymerase III subunit gamma/tau [Meiothermus sp. QL-1]|uniref:DNA polymerase III subunit gamma/tau n=1 Tax=Meiothermus sp. QL-1 TaxID=2058095 RepID=UPI000E0B3458|nr:DNA polymerase III subunit gamma/tau [Meiothermus sp. QL-1]RDI94507.1 DNA polymerase III subunit gamma/tau [Meiothermus sp. QL-1]